MQKKFQARIERLKKSTATFSNLTNNYALCVLRFTFGGAQCSLPWL